MRFLNWYSLSICLIVTIFVAMIASLFVRGSNNPLSGLSGLLFKKTADCQKFKKGFDAIAQQGAIEVPEILDLRSQKTKQSYITFLHSSADGNERIAQLWQSFQMHDPKARQIQSLVTEGEQHYAQAKRDYAKTLESQPGLPELASGHFLTQLIAPPNQAADEAYTKMQEAGRELEKYCPDLASPSSTPK